MSTVKQLLDSLLWDIYGKQQQVESAGDHRHNNILKRHRKNRNISKMARSFLGLSHDSNILQKLSVRKLVDICAILKVEIRLMGYFLERVLIERDRHQRHQEILCEFTDALLQLEYHDAHPKMRFSLSPPPTKATSAATSPTMHSQHRTSAKSDEEPTETADDAASDYKQWLHAMKLVARLPGGMPPEFRRKLWLSLADKYLKSKNLDWVKEEEKCFCEKWREDDEELGIQIVKDLHRTGSNLCTGPAGTINQAKLKRILLGYARYNPEVGYCQGFNMLGALILQVMDKEEAESMKVMIYLVEGVLPPGYFCGSMGGLQADMGVFRELMTSKLPRLAKHLQKLQGPIENAYEPPLTNVFTMQWFLTMFCTCLPMTCVLRVWDLVLIEGSDVLLRTALVLWSLLEERILSARTADDFYCKMGSFSSELLNGHLIDSNGLIEKVVQLGPIPDIQRLRDKHLYNIAPLRHKQGLQLYYDDEEPESDEESRLAVATVWGIPWGRRGSTGQTTNNKPLQLENKDRIALDISLLKKQYDRLRERQKQAHIILTTACSTAARQSSGNTGTNPTLPVNNLLMGRSAIVTKGRRIGPPTGAIPPARKPSLPTILQTPTRPPEKQLRRGETLHWQDTDLTKRRRDSLSWKEIKADRSVSCDNSENIQPPKLRTRLGKSDSSSYSEESDDTEGSSTDTSLCDEDDLLTSADKTHRSSSMENSPKKRSKSSRKQKELSSKLRHSTYSRESSRERRRPKSWAPSNDEIPFMLMTSESPIHSGDERSVKRRLYEEVTMKEEEDSATESDRLGYKFPDDLDWTGTKYSPLAGDLATTKLVPLHIQTDVLELPVITSMSQLSPLPDISKYLTSSTISPMPTPKPLFLDSTNSLGSGDGEESNKFDVSDDGVTNEYFERVNSVERPNKLDLFYSLSEEDSVRNAYESNDEEPIVEISPTENKILQISETETRPQEIPEREDIEGCEAINMDAETDVINDKRKIQEQIRMELLDDYSEKSSVAFIAEATNEVLTSYSKQKEHDLTNDIRITRSFGSENSDLIDIKNENRKTFQRKFSLSEASKKRRDPRRLTIARSYTIETADTYQRLDRNHFDEIKERDKENDKDSLEKKERHVIPSTADLKDRYNRLEKQLSEGKKSAEDTSLEISEEKSQSVECSTTSVKLDEDLVRAKRSEIPSTADLEDRFSALERQMSGPTLRQKNYDELIDDPIATEITRREKRLSEGKKSKEAIPLEISEVKIQSLECSTTSAKLDEALVRAKRSEIPTTADLEDRFSALETQMSGQTHRPRNGFELSNNPITTGSSKKKEVERGEKHFARPIAPSTELEAQPPGGNEETPVSFSPRKSISHNVKELPADISGTEIYSKNQAQIVKSTSKDDANTNSKNLSLSCSPTNGNIETLESTQNITQNHCNVPKEMSSNDTKIEKTAEDLKGKERQLSLEPSDLQIESQDTVTETTHGDYEMHSHTEPVKSSTRAELEKPADISELKKPSLPDCSTQNETRSMSDAEPEKSSRSHIPSTKDLENRFSALEKQMSSQSINSKDAIEMQQKSRDSKSEEKSVKAKNEQKSAPESSDAAAIKQTEAANSTQDVRADTDSKPRLSKIPSTAELEDRFNALERKMSISKKSPSKSKKEPPDGPRHKVESTVKVYTEEAQKLIVKDKPAKGAKEHDNIKAEKKTTDKGELAAQNTRSPPSTEELDKRFEAFEKTLSTANKLPDKKKEHIEKFPQKETQDSSKDDTQQSKSTKSFHEKVKTINEQIDDSNVTRTTRKDKIEDESRNLNESKKHAMKSFHTKAKVINETLIQGEGMQIDTKVPDSNSESQPHEQLPITSKRRASEPPTTEDLETRYEALKRRMSTKTFAESSDKKKTLLRSETVEEALERIEKEVLEETTEINQEEAAASQSEEEVVKKISPESVALMKSKDIVKRRASEPPTTEELEKRYEKLKRKMSTTTENFHESYELDDVDKKTTVKEELSGNTTYSKNVSNDQPTIPIPPPMQATNKQPPPTPPKVQNHRRALVRELQSKMIPNDKNLKPSDVNPNRKTPPHQHATMADDTSETHATTASMRLKNYEPSHMQPQKMVRRFSDLPSRADLENRVHFLEQQLSLKYVKQRSASDSEVASRTHFVGLKEALYDAPSTSAKTTRQGSDLENRVIALEKQLSENSLKLVEAMRQKSKERDEPIVQGSVSTAGPNVEGTQPDIRTGMELVRYTHYGEMEETESAKPINISINIKMHINKESEEKRKKIASPKTEVLEKRLEALEEKLSKSESNTTVLSKSEPLAKAGQTVVLGEEETEVKRDEKEISAAVATEEGTNEPKGESAKVLCTSIAKDEANKSSTTTQESTKTQEISELKPEESLAKQEPTKDSKQAQEIPCPKQQEALAKEPSEEKKQEQVNIDPKPINQALKQKSTVAEASSEVTAKDKTVNEAKSLQQKSTATEAASEVTVKDKAVNESKPSKAEEKIIKSTAPPSADSANTSSEKEQSTESKTQLKVLTSNSTAVEQNEPTNKNMVLPLDSEPSGNKVRRLTRANTEELEGLLQALEIQLSNRNLIKSEDGKLVRADSVPQSNTTQSTQSQEQYEALANLSKEIQEFTSADKEEKTAKVEKIGKTEKDEYDWGPDPVKRHLKRSTVYLPSTKELEARYRSLERQIRLLEDVEKIDVEQRLNEIERKIKLQYSLSHEKDLSKYLELCEGKLPDDDVVVPTTPSKSARSSRTTSPHTSPGRATVKTPYTSPTRAQDKAPYTSPTRTRERSPYTSPSPSRSSKRTTYTSPARQRHDDERLQTTDDLEYRYRVLDLVRSKSKDNLDCKLKKKPTLKKQPIHPLEMLLDPSPVESEIPTTGELEHRMHVLDEKCKTPSPPRRARQRSSSPTVDDLMREKRLEDRRPKTPIHSLETMVASPTKKELPTEEELEARMRALEQDQKFDFKMQKNYKEFNQKLRDVISPSLSFEEFKAAKSREQSPKRAATLPKSALKDHDIDYEREEITCRSTSPKMIRFREDEGEHYRTRTSKEYRDHHHHHQDPVKMVGTSYSVLTIIEENSKMLHHILKKTLADSSSSSISESGASSAKGLEVLGPRLMRETSPLRRTGTHTGITLRTDDNINDRLNSIKNTIKSIDTLCEEKPYRKEKCQRYIDSLFTESVYFASPSKKASLEDLAYKRRSGEYAPSIRISDHSQRPSEYLSRSMGSADSIRSTSPLRAASPLHHRSTRELRREISPRRHRVDEEREEYESRVRTRVNLLPKYYLDDSNESLSRSSLTKFYKVDNELDTYKLIDDKARSGSRSVSRSPLRSPYGSRETMTTFTTPHHNNTTTLSHTSTATSSSKRLDLDRPVSPYRQTSHNLLGYDSASFTHAKSPVYNPGKLEIRHTTVTSTFYDRLLTEKQIEKSLSRPPSRSPLVSPSGAVQSNLDIPMATSSVYSQKSSGNSPLTPVRSMGAGVGAGGDGFGLVGSGTNYLTSYNSDANKTTTNTFNTAATMPTGNSSAYPNSYLARLPPTVTDCNSTEFRLRSSENMLMQLGTTSVGAGHISNMPITTTTDKPTAILTTTTAAISSYATFLNTIGTGTGAGTGIGTATTTTTTNTAYNASNASFCLSSAGEYNPLMPLNLRPPPEIGIQLGHQQTNITNSTLNNNNTTTNSMNISQS